MKKYFIAGIVSIIYIPLITIAGELTAPLKNLLKSFFWHHWLGKSAILIILFITTVLVFGAFKFTNEENADKDNKYLIWTILSAMFSALAILVFFMVEYISHT